MSSLQVIQSSDGNLSLQGTIWTNTHQQVNLPFVGVTDLYGGQIPSDPESGTGAGFLKLEFNHPLIFSESTWKLDPSSEIPQIEKTFITLGVPKTVKIDIGEIFNEHIAPHLNSIQQ